MATRVNTMYEDNLLAITFRWDEIGATVQLELRLGTPHIIAEQAVATPKDSSERDIGLAARQAANKMVKDHFTKIVEWSNQA